MLALCLLLTAVTGTMAQNWPSRPIRIIVPFSAGSATDIIARVVGEQLSTQLGQSVVVENRLGAAGTIGAAAVAKAEADGHTLLVHSSSHTVAPATNANLPYDTARDFAAVIPLANMPTVLVVASTKPYKSVSDLVAAARARRGFVNYASTGAGSASHLNAERFRAAAEFEAVHIPVKGGPEALTEVLSERVDFYFSPLLPALPFLQDNKLKVLAVSGSKRSAALPNVPTTVELGFANSDYNFWIGMLAPAATPRAVVDRLHQETAKALQVAAVKERLIRLKVDPMSMTAAQFDKLVRDEIETNTKLMAAVRMN
jgi:tripartite-type tricarboxylate transporter receptor subunit TctC